MYDNSHMVEPQEEAGGRRQEAAEEVMCRGWSWVGGGKTDGRSRRMMFDSLDTVASWVRYLSHSSIQTWATPFLN